MNSMKVILKSFKARSVPEGDGVNVIRIIGTKELLQMDPFLLLDFGKGRLPTGFPDHPHRGFEAVSYMVKGTSYHEDFKGHAGRLEAGDCQWMTAGKGIVHAEMPGSFDEDTEALQLWINLPASLKMCDPAYQEYTKDKIPKVSKNGVTASIISGEALGVKGPIYARTPAIYIRFQLDPATEFEYELPEDWNALLYFFEGSAIVEGDKKLECKELSTVVFKPEEKGFFKVTTSKLESCNFILLAGKPLKEPIARYGPFVMNTEEELEQAFDDYSNERNGFEGARSWRSKIRDLANKK